MSEDAHRDEEQKEKPSSKDVDEARKPVDMGDARATSKVCLLGFPCLIIKTHILAALRVDKLLRKLSTSDHIKSLASLPMCKRVSSKMQILFLASTPECQTILLVYVTTDRRQPLN